MRTQVNMDGNGWGSVLGWALVATLPFWLRFRHHKTFRDDEELFLGFDFSTQSCTTVLVNSRNEIVYESQFTYHDAFPEFGCPQGFKRDHDDERIVTAPSLMFVKSLEKASQDIPIDLRRRVAGISGSAQQHGSIYWNEKAFTRPFSSDKPLDVQIKPWLTRLEGPIWMDSSTSSICDEIHKRLSQQAVSDETGSRCYERFTGVQIAKYFRTEPKFRTVTLISSGLTSILVGRFTPVDFNEASGTNLMDLRNKRWSDKMIKVFSEVAGTSLETFRGSLGEQPISSTQLVGNIDAYFNKRFGFSQDCQIVAFSGDNACAMAGLGVHEGEVVVSLGTSTTVLALVSNAKPNGEEGHVLVSPLNDDQYMIMSCFKNGDLPRAKLCKELCDFDWDRFNDLCRFDRFGNVTFAFLDPEITPITQRSGFLTFAIPEDCATPSLIPFDLLSPSDKVTSVILGQALSMRYHGSVLGMSSSKQIVATGGGSKSRAICQMLANVFQVNVYISTQVATSTAAFGAALRSRFGVTRNRTSRVVTFHQSVGALPRDLRAKPMKETAVHVERLMTAFSQMESVVMDELRASK